MIGGALSAVAVALLVGAVLRERYLRALIRGSEQNRTRGADGVVIGGESFELARPAAPAILLLHGAGDTPQSVRYLGDALHENGFHVLAPLLPRHGRNIREFSYLTADELSDAVRLAYSTLKAEHDWVAVIGLSMGGALAVQLAADHRDMPALGLVAPYLAMPPKLQRAAALSRVWGAVFPFVRSGEGVSLLDPNERAKNLAYGVFTPSALRALRDTVRRAVAALPSVAAPTLMIQSRTDNRISVGDAERAFSLLGAREKQLEWITGAAHVITVDYGRERVFAAMVAWMQARAPVGA